MLNSKFSAGWGGKSYYNALCELCYHYITHFERITCILPRLEEVERREGDINISRESWNRINSLAIELPKEQIIGQYAKRDEDEKEPPQPTDPILPHSEPPEAPSQLMHPSDFHPAPDSKKDGLPSEVLGAKAAIELEEKQSNTSEYQTSSGYHGGSLPITLPAPFSTIAETRSTLLGHTPGPAPRQDLPTRPKSVKLRRSKRKREPTQRMDDFRSSKIPRKLLPPPPDISDTPSDISENGESDDSDSDSSSSESDMDSD